jgi:hypothetical protein
MWLILVIKKKACWQVPRCLHARMVPSRLRGICPISVIKYNMRCNDRTIIYIMLFLNILHNFIIKRSHESIVENEEYSSFLSILFKIRTNTNVSAVLFINRQSPKIHNTFSYSSRLIIYCEPKILLTTNISIAKIEK